MYIIIQNIHCIPTRLMGLRSIITMFYIFLCTNDTVALAIDTVRGIFSRLNLKLPTLTGHRAPCAVGASALLVQWGTTAVQY